MLLTVLQELIKKRCTHLPVFLVQVMQLVPVGRAPTTLHVMMGIIKPLAALVIALLKRLMQPPVRSVRQAVLLVHTQQQTQRHGVLVVFQGIRYLVEVALFRQTVLVIHTKGQYLVLAIVVQAMQRVQAVQKYMISPVVLGTTRPLKQQQRAPIVEKVAHIQSVQEQH